MRWSGRRQARSLADDLLEIVDDGPSGIPPLVDLPLLVPSTEEHAARSRGALWDGL